LRNETKVGLLAVAAIVLLIVGYSYVSGKKLFTTKSTYYAVYKQVSGLQISNPVVINGYRVGEVEDIQISSPSNPQIRVAFSIKNDIKVPIGAKAEIYNADLLGSKAIRLRMDTVSGDLHQPGDTLRSGTKSSLQETIKTELAPIKDKTASLITQIDTLVRNVNMIMNKGGRKALANSIDNFNQSLENLEKSTQQVNTLLSDEEGEFRQVIKRASSVAKNLDQQSKAINNTMQNISNFSDSLAASDIKASIDTANRAINRFKSIMKKIDQGRGTAGKLVNDTQLYRNLEQSSAELDTLLKDVRKRPGRYVKIPIISF
jgi:phospholipid/cholesterol/gamma-HCH transport system substrate-binding protein